jgi:hypothetical protein
MTQTIPYLTDDEIDDLIRRWANFELSFVELRTRGLDDFAFAVGRLNKLGLKFPTRSIEDEPDPDMKRRRLAGQAALKEMFQQANEIERLRSEASH